VNERQAAPQLPAPGMPLRSWGSEEVAPARRPRAAPAGDGERPAAESGFDETPTRELPRTAVAGLHVLGEADRQRLQRDWERVQASFVDDPANAVDAADQLVAATMDRFCQQLDSERAALSAGRHARPAPTEDLRLMLQGYRKLLQRLLSA
jgi:hypothetical protein